MMNMKQDTHRQYYTIKSKKKKINHKNTENKIASFTHKVRTF